MFSFKGFYIYTHISFNTNIRSTSTKKITHSTLCKFPDIPNCNSRKLPVQSVQCSVKMASDEDRLIEIFREFVRNEMALQRSGSGSGSGSGSNASLLSRTRNLISNVSRSASREAAASLVQASLEAEVPTRKVKMFRSEKGESLFQHIGDALSYLVLGPVGLACTEFNESF